MLQKFLTVACADPACAGMNSAPEELNKQDRQKGGRGVGQSNFLA